MSDNVLPVTIDAQTSVSVLTAADKAAIHDYALAEKSAATRRAYRSDFAAFTAWCAGRALTPVPAAPETAAAFIADQANAGFRASTLGRRVAAIAYAHSLAGLEPPTNSKAVRVVLGGIRRKIGTRPAQKAPATAERIAVMLAKGAAGKWRAGHRARRSQRWSCVLALTQASAHSPMDTTCGLMRVTSGKSRVRESRLPESVRTEPNGRATRPQPHKLPLSCVFRRKAAGDSDPFQPVIPTEASH